MREGGGTATPLRNRAGQVPKWLRTSWYGRPLLRKLGGGYATRRKEATPRSPPDMAGATKTRGSQLQLLSCLSQ